MTVWAGMPTLLERSGSRHLAVESLLPQVDHLFLTPGDELGAVAKFSALEHMSPGSVFFGVDDDLIYPADYVKTTLNWLNRFPDDIVSYHGHTLLEDGTRYDNYRCLDEVEEHHYVHVVGDGVCAFRVDAFRPTIDQFPYPSATDSWFSLLAQRANVRRVVLPHPDRWFGYVEHRRTMWVETVNETGSLLDSTTARKEAVDELLDLIYPDREAECRS